VPNSPAAHQRNLKQGLQCVNQKIYLKKKKDKYIITIMFITVAYPGFFFSEGSTNSVADRGQRGRGLGAEAP
jgi:hypothetical protein